MFNKLSRILILCLTLCLRPDCAFATSGKNATVNEIMLETLLNSHREIKSGSTASDLIDRSGKELLNNTYNFINDPKNKKLLESESGHDLLKQQAILANYMAVKDHLNRCVKNKNDQRNLLNRIMSSALSSSQQLNNANAPCYAPNNSIKTYIDFNNQVIKAMKVRVSGDFLQEMNKSILINSMKSLLGLKYKFDKNFMASGALAQTEVKNLIKEICVKKSCEKISPHFVSEIENEAVEYSKKLKSQERRFNSAEATSSLNSSIDRLNQTLEKIAVKKNGGLIFDSANLSEPNTKKQFDQYVFNYMNEVAKDAGPILLTKTLREASGEIKSLSDDEVKKDKKTNQFKFNPHLHITESQFNQALIEAHDKIIDQAAETEKIITSEQHRKASKVNVFEYQRQDEIDNLIKINPLAAGQILIHSPEYAGLVCDSINRISEKSDRNAQFDKYFMAGSAILGGALLLTGIGTVAGAYILTGSATAAFAAETAGAAILATTVVAGAATEASMAAYMGIKAYDSYEEMNKIERALLTQNTDAASIIEKRDAYLSFKDARMKSMMSLASAGLSVVGLDKFYSLTKFAGSSLSLSEFKATTKIMEYLSENSVAQKLAQVAKIAGNKGSDLIDQFLFALAKTGEKVRLSTLDLLKDSSMTPKKLKEIFEEALEVSKKCRQT